MKKRIPFRELKNIYVAIQAALRTYNNFIFIGVCMQNALLWAIGDVI